MMVGSMLVGLGEGAVGKEGGGAEGASSTCCARFANVSREGSSSQLGAHICFSIVIREDLGVPLTACCSAGSLVGAPKVRLAFTSVHLHLPFTQHRSQAVPIHAQLLCICNATMTVNMSMTIVTAAHLSPEMGLYSAAMDLSMHRDGKQSSTPQNRLI